MNSTSSAYSQTLIRDSNESLLFVSVAIFLFTPYISVHWLLWSRNGYNSGLEETILWELEHPKGWTLQKCGYETCFHRSSSAFWKMYNVLTSYEGQESWWHLASCRNLHIVPIPISPFLPSSPLFFLFLFLSITLGISLSVSYLW